MRTRVYITVVMPSNRTDQAWNLPHNSALPVERATINNDDDTSNISEEHKQPASHQQDNTSSNKDNKVGSNKDNKVGSTKDNEVGSNHSVQPQSKANANTSSSNKTKAKTYTLQPGESLTQISVRFYHTKDSVRAIIRKNNFSNPDNVPAGSVIKLP